VCSSAELRKRLEDLNRKPLPRGTEPLADAERIRRALQKKRKTGGSEQRGDAPRGESQPVIYRRHAPLRSSSPTRQPQPSPAGPPIDLEEAVSGTEVDTPDSGRLFLIERGPAELDETDLHATEAFQHRLAKQDSPLHQALSGFSSAGRLLPRDVIFLDLETTGLGTAPLFLIGTLSWEAGQPVVRQYLARDYAEERPAIALFFDHLAPKKLLVTFNGKSYDWPFVRTRAVYHRLPPALERAHFDLLHPARRTWGGMLPDCRLATLESYICGRHRQGDIPGAEIPDAYHAFVRTKNAAQIVQILKHNLHDLITMADLVVQLVPGEGSA